MRHNYLNNIPLDEAKRIFSEHLKKAGFACRTETIPVTGACGRVIKNAAYARICSPHYNASAMDGIALSARCTFGAGETTPVTLTADQYVTVDTGDPVPEGCDAVVMIEDVIHQEDGTVRLYAPAAPWQR